MSAVSGAPALELVGVSKRYGGVAANRDISLSVARGEIHAIVGENGAGKSTLMSILGGLVRADSGAILIDGREARINSPRDAAALGVGMTRQHFQLVDTMSALDNILLGDEGGALLARGRARLRAKLSGIADETGLAIDLDARAGDLPLGARQRVEILKALARGARVLIFDEPTAVLTPDEASGLFRLMKSLAGKGASILFITHKLGEALGVADRVSVLRAGERVATFDAKGLSAETLAEAMVGQRPPPRAEKPSSAPGEILVEARGMRLRGADGRALLDDVSLSLRAGEIVGVAGVAGNGQSELLEVLAGLRRPNSGTLRVAGLDIDFTRFTPAAARALGVAHIPEDRLKQGVVAGFRADHNAMLGRQREARFGGRWLNPAAITRHCADLMARWDVRPASPGLAISSFSGGNQQKLVFAREIETDPRVLLVGQPTRGVDISAIDAIHRRLTALRGAGKAILLVSAELDEILALSDRALVMRGGRIVGERAPGAANARRDIGLMMAGAAEAAA